MFQVWKNVRPIGLGDIRYPFTLSSLINLGVCVPSTTYPVKSNQLPLPVEDFKGLERINEELKRINKELVTKLKAKQHEMEGLKSMIHELESKASTKKWCVRNHDRLPPTQIQSIGKESIGAASAKGVYVTTAEPAKHA